MFISVDFPLPEGPINAIKSPASISKLIPLSTANSASPILYVFIMSFSSITFNSIHHCCIAEI